MKEVEQYAGCMKSLLRDSANLLQGFSVIKQHNSQVGEQQHSSCLREIIQAANRRKESDLLNNSQEEEGIA
jgi:hypothetical protein